MLQLGAVLAEVLDQGRHEVLAGRENGAEAQPLLSPGGDPPRGLGALLEQADDVAGIAGVLAAGRGGPHIATGALGQLDAQLALERGDGGGHARLRDVELLRGGGDRSVANDGQKGGQLSMSNGHGKPESI